MSDLAEPTPEAIALIRQHAPNGVVEIGAGDGHWGAAIANAGIPWVGYDLERPIGLNVVQGDHIDASQHRDRACLIVWPANHAPLSDWLKPFQTAFLCGQFNRFSAPLFDFKPVAQVEIPTGRKGASILKVLSRL